MPAEEMKGAPLDDYGKRKKNILVGVRMNSQSRELLDWALVKIAEAGDCVVAIHVCRNSDTDHLSEHRALLDDYLQVYEGLCSANKVDLKGHVTAGRSISRALVREAKSCSAVAVVVGIRNQSALGSLSSVAKRCAKQLPATTEILAIHKGKVVYRRSNRNLEPGLNQDPRPSLESWKGSRSEFGDSETSSEVSKDEISMSVHELRSAPARSISLPARDVLGPKPGWPLLRRASSGSTNLLHSRNISVVRWVMNLPERFPQQNPDHLAAQGQSSVVCKLRQAIEVQTGRDFPAGKWLSYEVLRAATFDFSPENLIGKGGCNRVYKGIFPDKKPVAVKLMKSSREECWKDFAHEISMISSLKHKNVRPLLGICIQDSELISVYDFSSKGSLEENLHGKHRDKDSLPWEDRFNIAVGIAEALDYLHNECSPQVIHRDVKSSNIILLDQFEPQLSDFGLAMRGPSSSSFVIEADVVGTFGYLAPEYFMYGKVSDKIDVYACGVVLLELLSGRRPISSETTKGQESLVMWAKPVMEKGDSRCILDPNLSGDLDENQFRRMVLAASLCLRQAATLRPNIREILGLLRGDGEMEKWIASHGNESQGCDDDEVYPNIRADLHLSLALLGAEDDSASQSSLDQGNILFSEEFLKERWSQSSSSG